MRYEAEYQELKGIPNFQRKYKKILSFLWMSDSCTLTKLFTFGSLAHIQPSIYLDT
jgi:hypothetical protein